jgi:hypothetical protein
MTVKFQPLFFDNKQRVLGTAALFAMAQHPNFLDLDESQLLN